MFIHRLKPGIYVNVKGRRGAQFDNNDDTNYYSVIDDIALAKSTEECSRR